MITLCWWLKIPAVFQVLWTGRNWVMKLSLDLGFLLLFRGEWLNPEWLIIANLDEKKKGIWFTEKSYIFTHTYAISSLVLQLLFNKERDKTRRWNLKNREKEKTSHFPSCPTEQPPSLKKASFMLNAYFPVDSAHPGSILRSTKADALSPVFFVLFSQLGCYLRFFPL